MGVHAINSVSSATSVPSSVQGAQDYDQKEINFLNDLKSFEAVLNEYLKYGVSFDELMSKAQTLANDLDQLLKGSNQDDDMANFFQFGKGPSDGYYLLTGAIEDLVTGDRGRAESDFQMLAYDKTGGLIQEAQAGLQDFHQKYPF